PRVAVLGHDARHDLLERVAPLQAPCLQVGSVAGDHGSGLHGSGEQETPSPMNTAPWPLHWHFGLMLQTPFWQQAPSTHSCKHSSSVANPPEGAMPETPDLLAEG
ncbi:hypothetical protein EBQ81_00475, partial [bacterium]|nr:hypothetical protein [bacterium]